MPKKKLIIIFLTLFILTTLSAQEETKDRETWTVKNNTWLCWDTYQSKGEPPIELKQVWAGTKVIPFANQAFSFKVELPSGEYGFILADDLEEANWVVNERADSIKFYPNAEYGQGKYKLLPPGTKAYRLATIQNGGVYTVRLEDGRTGSVIRHYMRSPYFKSLPTVNQEFHRIYSIEIMEEKIIEKTREETIDFLGPASAFIYTTNDQTSSELYFEYVIAVQNNMRHRGIKVRYTNNEAKEIVLFDKAKKSIAEKLPLAGLVRSIDFNWLNNRKANYYDQSKTNWWTKFRKKNFFTKMLGFIVGLIGLIIFFSIPQLISWPFRRLINSIKPLGNGLVKFINFILLTAFMYFFFLVLVLYMILTQFLIMAIFTLIPWFIYIKCNNSTINYNRCPRCHTMWSAEDKGSTHTGTEKSRAWKTRDVYKGSTTSGNVTTKHYDRHNDEEITTKESYLDHRKCQNCGYDWDVNRVETSKHTIKH